ncbi:acyl-CoA dehydrogenase [Pseudomonas sp. F1_0610]|uniref:acyl-CoA dehydrogenase n=1 Tax=Pseudomonas sp. F1_0610 TaxID=3114284 RepID=UPI0039C130A9
MLWTKLLSPVTKLPKQPLPAWFNQLKDLVSLDTPFDFSVLGGRAALNPSYAFFAGYQAALHDLLPDAPDGIGAFCISEERKVQPSELNTRLDQGKVTGFKDFATCATFASWFIVLARIEQKEQPVQLEACLIAKEAKNLVVTELPALSFLPDISHGKITLSDTPALRLPGDGWDDYAKRFRILEDAYVLAALSGWLYSCAIEEKWPHTLITSLTGILACIRQALSIPTNEPSMHLLLESGFMQFEDLAFELVSTMHKVQSPHLADWKRDREILNLSRYPRHKRLSNALTALRLI